MRKGHTVWKIGHHRHDSLIWTPTQGEIPEGEVLRGSREWLAIMEAEEEQWNFLANEGELDILDVYFNNQAVRSSLFGRLYNDTPVETDALTDLTGEVTGTGYAAVEFVRDTDWGEPALDSGDGMTTSTTKVFTAGGAWSAATYIVLATVGSGTSGLLIAAVALSATRTLANGDTLDVSFNVKLA